MTATGDTYWANVTLLALNNNGANNSTSFTDQSSLARTLTAAGDAKWTTTSPPTGLTSSATFDGTGDEIGCGSSAGDSFGTGDYTVEFMCKWTSYSSTTDVAVVGANNWGSGDGWVFSRYNTGGGWIWYHKSSAVVTFNTFTPTNGQWYHIAITRSGTSVKVFIDGTQYGSTGTSSTDLSSVPACTIGGATNASAVNHNGGLASVRITKGVARYTAGFTPPTLPLPNS